MKLKIHHLYLNTRQQMQREDEMLSACYRRPFKASRKIQQQRNCAVLATTAHTQQRMKLTQATSPCW